jgi:hypothetical protein
MISFRPATAHPFVGLRFRCRIGLINAAFIDLLRKIDALTLKVGGQALPRMWRRQFENGCGKNRRKARDAIPQR